MRNNEEQYRQEWATLTGRAPSDIYIPEAIRDPADDGPMVVDEDDMPHEPFTEDIHGVPYSRPVCGMDGEYWPCTEAQRQAAPHDFEPHENWKV